MASPTLPKPESGSAFSCEQMKGYAQAAIDAEREACAQLCELTKAEILLRAGEMDAQELRTVSAVLAGRASAIRNRG